MTISLIVAASQNDVIGKDNQLPWHLPADMKYLKNVTLGHHVIMGRKTFDALGKPLPGRTNIIITRQEDFTADGCIVVNDIHHAIDYAKAHDETECFIIGGGDIFIQSLIWADRIYLTRVMHKFEGDTFFPQLAEGDWNEVKVERHLNDEKNKYPYAFMVYDRNYN
jgi:dihydrofolate reductase